jgi:hypothetical protein
LNLISAGERRELLQRPFETIRNLDTLWPKESNVSFFPDGYQYTLPEYLQEEETTSNGEAVNTGGNQTDSSGGGPAGGPSGGGPAGGNAGTDAGNNGGGGGDAGAGGGGAGAGTDGSNIEHIFEGNGGGEENVNGGGNSGQYALLDLVEVAEAINDLFKAPSGEDALGRRERSRPYVRI